MIGRDGILLIDKNEGYTSSDTVRMVGRKLGAKKAGHTGTLDRFASGLLVCLVGSFTRLASYLVEQDKVYEAVIEFGRETETLDPEGAETARGEIPGLAAVEAVLPEFRGLISQKPPLYSAVHIDGKRAYKRALKGEQVEMPAREVRIDSLEVLSFEEPFLTLRVACSKGTYIRSLARDIAYAAGTVAHVGKLRRLQVGTAQVTDALKPTEIDGVTALIQNREDIERYLGLSGVTVPDEYIDSFLAGRQLDAAALLPEGPTDDGRLVCFDGSGRFLGVLVGSEGRLRYGMVNGSLRH